MKERDVMVSGQSFNGHNNKSTPPGQTADFSHSQRDRAITQRRGLTVGQLVNWSIGERGLASASGVINDEDAGEQSRQCEAPWRGTLGKEHNLLPESRVGRVE